MVTSIVVPFVATEGVAATEPATVQTALCDETVEGGGSIQDAIDGADEGATICLDDGTYGEELLITVDGITLTAAQGATPVLDGESGDTGIRIQADGVTIDGLAIEGYVGALSVTSNDVTITNTTVTNNLGTESTPAIRFDGTSGGVVTDSTVTDNGQHGIDFRASADVLVEGNTVHNNSRGIHLSQVDSAEVTDNAVTDSLGTGIWFRESTAVTLAANTLDGNRHGIESRPSTNVGVIVEDNTVSSERVDLSLGATTDATVVDNAFETGVVVRGSANSWDETYFLHEFDGNTVNGDPLVYVKNEDDPHIDPTAGQLIVANSTNVDISGFEFDDVPAGIQLAHIDGAHVTDNTVTNGTDTSVGGITVMTSSGVLVDDNDAEAFAYGIQLIGGTGVTVSNNTVSDASTEHIEDHGMGILIEDDGQDHVVRNNTVTGADEDGVHVRQGVDGTLIESNAIENNARDGVHVRWNSYNTVVNDNTVVGNGDRGLFLDRAGYATLERNEIRENTHGIVAGRDVDHLTIDDNEITQNTWGIQLEPPGPFTQGDAPRYATITNNQITDNDQDGISLDEATGATITHNTLADNGHVHPDFSYLTYGNGIELSDAPNATLEENVIEGSVVDGIAVGSGSDDAMMANNTVADSGEDGISVDAPGATLRNNAIVDNTDGVTSDSDEVDARWNWWGHDNGPSGTVDDPETDEPAAGTGDSVSANVLFDPWLESDPVDGAPENGDAPDDGGAFFEVSNVSTNAPIDAGEALEVEVTIANTGDETGTQTVSLEAFDGSVVDSTETTLDGAAGEEAALTWETETDDHGQGQITVQTEDDSISETVLVSTDETIAVDTCTVIDAPGHYALTGDLTGSETCLEIVADDVVLDGMGHTIEGIDVSDNGTQYGISVNDADSVTITDVTVRGWDTGLYYNDASDGTVTDVVTENNTSGFTLNGANDNDVTNLTTRYNSNRGLTVGSIRASHRNTFTNVTAYGNEDEQSGFFPGTVYLGSGGSNEFIGLNASNNQAGLAVNAPSNSFTDVTADDNSRYGVNVESGFGTFDGISVSGNGWHGVRISESNGNELTNVTAYENDGTAIYLRGDLSGGPALTGTVMDSVTVFDNDGSGIQLSNADNNEFSNITLTNNTETSLNLASRSDGNTFTNVTTIDSGWHGVAAGSNSHDNEFTDITATNSEAAGIAFLTDATGNSVTNATVSGTGNGYQTMGGSTDNTVSNLDLDGVTLSVAAQDVTVNSASEPDQLPTDATPIDAYVSLSQAGANTHVESLQIHYDSADLPEVDESALGLWRLDDDDVWRSPAEEPYDSSVDTTEQYVDAENITEFGTFGVFSEAPRPIPAVTDPSVSDTQLLEGDTATVTATVENVGQEAGDLVVELEIDGSVEVTETVELDVGETTEVEFTHTFATEGSYEVSVGGVVADTITVSEPVAGDIVVFGGSATPDSVDVTAGETVTITGDLYNQGDLEDNEMIELTVDGEVIDETTVTLDAGVLDRDGVEFEWTPDSDILGDENSVDVEIALNGFIVETVTVEERYSDVQVIAASTAETELVEGETTYTIGSLYQNGTIDGPEEIELTATHTETGETEVVGTQEVTLSPGFYHLGALNISFTPDQAGTYELELGDRNAGTVEVEAAESDIQVIAASASEVELVEHETMYVVGSIYQNGTIGGTEEIELTATHTETGDTEVVGTQEVTLSPGFYHLGALNVSFTPDDAGTYDLELGERNAGTVEVEAAESDIQVIAASTSDVELIENETTHVVGSIYQAGNIEGTEEIELTATHTGTGETEVVGTQEVTLSPGFYHLGALNVSFTPDEAGTYELELGDRNAGWVEVEAAESDIQVIAASTADVELIEGEDTYVVGSIYQNGTIEGTEEIELTATHNETGETEVVGMQEVTLAPGFYHLGALNVSFTPDEAGMYDLELGDRNAGWVEVEAAESDIQVIAASASDVEIVEGETTHVVGSIYQGGNIEGSEEIELTATHTETGETEVVGTQEVTLSPGFYHLGALNVSFTPDDPGTYDLELGDRNAGTIEVEESDSDIQVIGSSISEVELIENETTYVTGSIYQAGTSDGPEEIELVATHNETGESHVVGSQNVTLEPGFYHLGALNISFTPDEAGTYDLELGGQDAGWIAVEEAITDITVIASSVSEVELVEGEKAHVTGSIYQGGNVEATEEIELVATHNETGESFVAGSQNVTLAPGFYHLGALNITFAPDDPGVYDLQLGDRNAGTVEIEPAESDIQVIAASTADVELIEGEDTYVVGSIYQAGNIEGTEEIELTATHNETGETHVVGTQEVTLSPGFYHLGALNVSFTPDQPGTYDLELGDRNAGWVEVEAAESDIQVIAASTSEIELIENETTHVVGSIHQAGNIEGTEEIELTATHLGTGETEVVGTQEVTLSPGFYHLGALNVSFTPDKAGIYELELGDRNAGTVEVEAAESDIQVIAASTSEIELVAGETTHVIGSVYQNGTIDGPEEIELTATHTETGETEVVGSQELTLSPGFYHLGGINVSFTPDDSGVYDLELGERNAGTVEVEAAESDMQVIAASVSEIEIVQGETVDVIGSVYQNGTVDGPEEIELTATHTETGETEVVGSQELTLSPGFYHLGALNVSFAPDDSGVYDLELGDRSAGSVTVSEAEIDASIISVSGHSTDVDPETEDETVYASDSATVTAEVEADLELDEVTVLVNSLDTTYVVGVEADHVGDDKWEATIPFGQLPDDGRYELTVIAADVLDNGDSDIADVVLAVDRDAPSMATSFEDVNNDGATVVVESDGPLSDVPDVTVERPDGTSTSVTMDWDGTTRFVGTLAFSESGEYEATADGTDRAGNVGSDTASVTVDTRWTLEEGTITNEVTGTTIDFELIDDADMAMKTQDLFVALSENTVNANLDGGEHGVGFMTAELDSFIDLQFEQGTIEGATVSMAIDEEELPANTELDDVDLYHYDESETAWNEVDSDVALLDDDPFVVADVTGFSTYGALVVDEEPPALVSVSPADGTTLDADDDDVTVRFEYEDELSGVDHSSVELVVDGVDVTDDIDRTNITSSVAKHTIDIEEGATYDVAVTVADNAGNDATYATQFTAPDDSTDSSPPLQSPAPSPPEETPTPTPAPDETPTPTPDKPSTPTPTPDETQPPEETPTPTPASDGTPSATETPSPTPEGPTPTETPDDAEDSPGFGLTAALVALLLSIGLLHRRLNA